jgi:hypothetical protein
VIAMSATSASTHSWDSDYCVPTVVAAMNFLAHADTLIIDLRRGSGSDPIDGFWAFCTRTSSSAIRSSPIHKLPTPNSLTLSGGVFSTKNKG